MSLSNALLLDPYPFNKYLAIRSDQLAGTGTLSDPLNANTSTTFDTLMSSFPESTRVHLGPGTFETKGYYDGLTGGFQAKKGMKIIGAGIDVSTLKIAGSTESDKQFFAIGHAIPDSGSFTPPDFFEVSDLTIDCNLGGKTGSLVACGAIRVMGSHVIISRVKAINWGSNGARPCLVFSLVTGHLVGTTPRETVDAGIRDCMAIQAGQKRDRAGDRRARVPPYATEAVHWPNLIAEIRIVRGVMRGVVSTYNICRSKTSRCSVYELRLPERPLDLWINNAGHQKYWN